MWTKRGKACLILIFSTNTNCENMANQCCLFSLTCWISGARWTESGHGFEQNMFLGEDLPFEWWKIWLLVHSVVKLLWQTLTFWNLVGTINLPFQVAKAGDYPELPLKAWTSRVVTSFLCVALQDVSKRFANDERNHELALATPAKTNRSNPI